MQHTSPAKRSSRQSARVFVSQLLLTGRAPAFLATPKFVYVVIHNGESFPRDVRRHL